jgi:hypothetical protein
VILEDLLKGILLNKSEMLEGIGDLISTSIDFIDAVFVVG